MATPIAVPMAVAMARPIATLWLGTWQRDSKTMPPTPTPTPIPFFISPFHAVVASNSKSSSSVTREARNDLELRASHAN